MIPWLVLKTFKDIPYNTVKQFVPFFCDKPLSEISTKSSKKLVFLLCDTVKRLTDDIKILKAQLEELKK